MAARADDPSARRACKRKIATYTENEEEASFDNQSPGKKSRKVQETHEVIDLTADSPKKPSPSKRKGKRDSDAPAEEKRLRQFRKKAPQTYLVVKERALTQRLTVLSRERCGEYDAPGEKVMVGVAQGWDKVVLSVVLVLRSGRVVGVNLISRRSVFPSMELLSS